MLARNSLKSGKTFLLAINLAISLYSRGRYLYQNRYILELSMPQVKKVVWLGSSLKDLKDLPDSVQDDIGYALWRVQEGKEHQDIKLLKGLPGVFEIGIDYDRDTYRAVYTVNIGDVIYVLHVFKKKSKKGIALPKEDADLIQSRLKWAKELVNEKK